MGNPTVFVDNLPHQIRKIWVYNLFSKFGKIMDIFIPNKKSKITGQSFGFVRFNRSDDAAFAISVVNNSWYWGQRLIVHYARFLRSIDGNFINLSRRNTASQRHMNVKFAKPLRFNTQSEQRGKEIWRKKGVTESSKQGEARNKRIIDDAEKVFDESSEPKTLSIHIQTVGYGWLFRSAIAKVKRLLSTNDLESIFLRNGIQNIQIKAIGGRFVIITFSDPAARNAAINLDWISNWFEEFKPWEGEQAKVERFVWLACFGMPLNVWSVPTFKEIGSKWGHFFQVDENTLKGESFEKARILITSEKSQKIEGNMELIVEGKKYMVRVEEEDSFRVIKRNLLTAHNKETKRLEVEDDDMEDDGAKDVEKNKFQLVGNADVVANTFKEGNIIAEMVSKENQGCVNNQLQACTGVQLINDLATTASSTSSGFVASAVGSARVIDSEKVMDSFDGALNNPNCFGETNNEVINSENLGTNMTAALEESILQKDNNISVYINNREEFEDNPIEDGNDESQIDLFAENNPQVQATIKSAKGKKKRKTIDEILGYSKEKPCYQKKGRRKNKCVVLRSAIAAVALSASVSTEGISNRNKIILSEAQAIRQMNRLIGYKYDGEDEEVISKIAELEAQEKEEGVEDKILPPPQDC